MNYTLKEMLSIALFFSLFYLINDYLVHKISCYFSIKHKRRYCDCWDCKNPKCNLFDKREYKEIDYNLVKCRFIRLLIHLRLIRTYADLYCYYSRFGLLHNGEPLSGYWFNYNLELIEKLNKRR